MSAGNHAQAVAYHAQRLGIPATIVMPVTTPFVKVKATEALGATVVLDGETLTEAQARAEAIAAERDLVWVHPYDDPRIIAGQGTIALEMLEEAPDLDVLVIPIGGGGLIAGNAIAARATKPSIEIVGVECALYPSMWNAIHHGNMPCGGATLAEGIAVKNVGTLTLPVVRELGERHHAGRRAADRARGECLSDACRRPWRKGQAPPGSPPCWPSRSAFAAARSA